MTPSLKTTLPASARYNAGRITKTDFVRFVECPLYAWLWKNRPDLREEYVQSRLAKQGYKVEEIAEAIMEKHSGKIKIECQMKAVTEKFYARADIMKPSTDGKSWHLYEVKSSTEVKKEHYADICFQYRAFTLAGYKIASLNIVLVNNDYVYDESKGLEPEQFIKIVDLTSDIHEKIDEYAPEMERAHRLLTAKEEPHVVTLKKSFKYDPPQKFSDYYHHDIPPYSIFNIARISKQSLEKLTALGVEEITKIPDGFFKSDTQNLQVELTKNRTSFIDYDAIREELAGLEYPIYFLDYETISPAIPLYNNMKPYQQIPFQFSLHIVDAQENNPPKKDIPAHPDIPPAKDIPEHPEIEPAKDIPPAEDIPEHPEIPPAEEVPPFQYLKSTGYLHTEKTNPVPHLVKALKDSIGPKGTVIVWNKKFECECNKGMARAVPEYAPFLEDLNSRIYDLMLIFKDKYLDYRFKGSASIKNVLPILAPKLSYKDLEISEGGSASEAIYQIANIYPEMSPDDFPPLTPETRDQLIADLKTYCERDTFAMVEILRNLVYRDQVSTLE